PCSPSLRALSPPWSSLPSPASLSRLPASRNGASVRIVFTRLRVSAAMPVVTGTAAHVDATTRVFTITLADTAESRLTGILEPVEEPRFAGVP
ncbi:hypothetical protein BGZ99_007635, partial [Dissophora globulifera]